MFDINLPIAFGAGLTSFFAPCVVPLLPAYIGYVTGVSVKDLKEKGYAKFRKQMLVSSLFYILGLLLLTDTYKYLNSWLFETAFSFGYEIR